MLSQTTIFMLLSAIMGKTIAGSADADSKVMPYYQCGGLSYTGASQCTEGYSCSSQNPYYYQCVASGGSAAAATTTSNAATTAETEAGTPDSAASTNGNVSYVTSETTVSVTTCSTSAVVDNAASAATTSTAATKAVTSAADDNTTTAADEDTSSSGSGAKTATSSAASSSSSGSSDLETISGGFSGSADTTRYWDCCLPSYSWNGKSSSVPEGQTVNACDADGNVLSGYDFQSGCIGGDAYMCNDQTPWAISDSLAYGFAAASVIDSTDESLACTCMKLTFTSTSLEGKVMVVQITNSGDDLTDNHFDIALPGGGVGYFTDGCTSEFGSGYSWGEQYGGVSSESDCSSLPSALQSGCDFRFDWFDGADNPSVDFEQVVCPEAITSLSGCSRTDE